MLLGVLANVIISTGEGLATFLSLILHLLQAKAFLEQWLSRVTRPEMFDPFSEQSSDLGGSLYRYNSI